MIYTESTDNLGDEECICMVLAGSEDGLSEFLSPEEIELFSLWDANRTMLRQPNFGSFMQEKQNNNSNNKKPAQT